MFSEQSFDFSNLPPKTAFFLAFDVGTTKLVEKFDSMYHASASLYKSILVHRLSVRTSFDLVSENIVNALTFNLQL